MALVSPLEKVDNILKIIIFFYLKNTYKTALGKDMFMLILLMIKSTNRE